MINFLKNFCWHKWKYVYAEYKYNFMGEWCTKRQTEYRICEKCGKAQYPFCHCWKTLTKCETNILMKHLIDKRDHYILRGKEND